MTPLYRGSRFPLLRGKPFPGPWYNPGYWAYDPATGLINAPPTVEKVSNGGFEVDAAGWVDAGYGGAIVGGQAGGYSGNCAIITRGTNQICIKQNLTTPAAWHLYQLAGKNGTGTARSGLRLQAGGGLLTSLYSYGAAWVYRQKLLWVTGNSYHSLEDSGANGTTAYFDSASLLAYQSAHLGFSRNLGWNVGLLAVPLMDVAFPALTMAGIRFCESNPSNPLNHFTAYHDGTNINLDKVIAGVRTSIFSTATGAAYTANRFLVVKRTATVVQVFYNDAGDDLSGQISSDYTLVGGDPGGTWAGPVSNGNAHFDLARWKNIPA